MITHYIQLYRYNDALKVLTEKASEALQHGSEAVGRDGGREGGGERGREGGGERGREGGREEVERIAERYLVIPIL